MTTTHTWSEWLKKYEKEMQQLETDKEYTFSVYEKMHNVLDSCLKSKNYASLFQLLPYFEDPDSHPQLHYSADARRIHILLNILKIELKYQKPCFGSTVDCYEDFFEQYIQTIFCLRRLELALYPELMNEAAEYLRSISISIYAAKLITENEYFENFETLYWNTYFTMESVWSVEDKILWLNFLLEKVTSPQILTELASLCIEIGDYKQAYQHLDSIPSPSPEITDMITTLKDFLHNE